MSKYHNLILIGGGGHASVLLDILLSQGKNVIAYISPQNASNMALFKGITHHKSDEDINLYDASKVLIVNGLGHMPKNNLRSKVYTKFVNSGFKFTSVIADSAVISKYASIAGDAQILTGAIVNGGASIGRNTIINTAAIVEHDSVIKEHTHLAPNTTICGNSIIGAHCFIGSSATIIQGLEVGCHSIIGAGVTLLETVSENSFISLKRN
ncbi:NeuD/PglB/VioB family sugar acetyltransferase [Shewanella pneumatophori]|uniref:NeuD/PglB/VioB family sugar acetyltransferase n=1 Tax=Shewanella pneumatophori TaxID=314092 RepID=A0A9X2CDT8_9GAMM|nr:NeuD/PglB/VioB family sugar acetyltransferase [Shewanella pneumatophori]